MHDAWHVFLQVFKYLRSNNNFISGTLPPQFGSMSQLEQV